MSAAPPKPLKSNLKQWQMLQEQGYFEKHPCYHGLAELMTLEATEIIELFFPLNRSMNAVVIGCGYGRETLGLAPLVNHVWGIDVSTLILEKAARFLNDRNVCNFTSVLAQSYTTEVPEGIDLVFSLVVMQHLTRDLVRDYFVGLTQKLRDDGHFVVQFLEDLIKRPDSLDADTNVAYEPSVSWTAPEIVELARLAGLDVVEIRTRLVTSSSLWHFACLRKGSAPR